MGIRNSILWASPETTSAPSSHPISKLGSFSGVRPRLWAKEADLGITPHLSDPVGKLELAHPFAYTLLSIKVLQAVEMAPPGKCIVESPELLTQSYELETVKAGFLSPMVIVVSKRAVDFVVVATALDNISLRESGCDETGEELLDGFAIAFDEFGLAASVLPQAVSTKLRPASSSEDLTHDLTMGAKVQDRDDGRASGPTAGSQGGARPRMVGPTPVEGCLHLGAVGESFS